MESLKLVDTDTTTEFSKGENSQRRRRSIELIEVQPRPEWTISAKTEKGRELWWLRFSVTGLRTRRYGPFKSESVALLVLDDMLDAMSDAMSGFQEIADRDLVQERFGKRWPTEIIEDEFMEKPA